MDSYEITERESDLLMIRFAIYMMFSHKKSYYVQCASQHNISRRIRIKLTADSKKFASYLNLFLEKDQENTFQKIIFSFLFSSQVTQLS